MNHILLALIVSVFLVNTFSARVVVTGGAGRTGSLVFKRLLEFKNDFDAVAVVKSQGSKKKLLKKFPSSNVVVGDIRDPSSLEDIFQNTDKVVLCTSAVPKIKFFSILKVLIFKLLKKTARPEFKFEKEGDPYYVDWIGAKNTIDAAKKAGVKQFVFVSSMGGTQPDNFLNTIGRVAGNENSGNILLWKRKAEKYLIESGIPYTIIHPGGLLDKEGGVREVVFGVDDVLLTAKTKSIPRADVAEVCVQSMLRANSLNRSFDIVSKEPGDGQITTNWDGFFNQSGNCKYD